MACQLQLSAAAPAEVLAPLPRLQPAHRQQKRSSWRLSAAAAGHWVPAAGSLPPGHRQQAAGIFKGALRAHQLLPERVGSVCGYAAVQLEGGHMLHLSPQYFQSQLQARMGGERGREGFITWQCSRAEAASIG